MILIFYVPVKPVNLKNARLSWPAEYRYREQLRGWTATVGKAAMERAHVAWPAESPKRITLTAHLPRFYDPQDGLRMALAPALDGLQPQSMVPIRRGARKGQMTVLAGCGLIHHDGPGCGHQITYTQDHEQPYGVTITVQARK